MKLSLHKIGWQFLGLVLTGAAQVAAAEESKLFAAPTAAAHETTPSGSVGQVTLALGIVLLVVFAASVGLRWLRRLNVSGSDQQLHVVAQIAIGAKERAVIIRAHDTHVLVGVTPTQVTALHSWAVPAASEQVERPPSAEKSGTPNFKMLLKQSLGMKS